MLPPKIKKALGVTLQTGVTAVLLALVFHDPYRRAQMAQAGREADWRWLTAGLLIYGGVEALAVVRWQLLLRTQGFNLRWQRATGILFISEFFLTFTPGLVGGDAMRMYYLVKDEPKKKVDAFTVVLMDRVMGLMTLIGLATIIIGARYGWLSQTSATTRLVQAAILVLGSGAMLLGAALWLATRDLPRSWRLPTLLRETAEAMHHFAQARRRTAIALLTTVLSHGCYYTSFCCAARALSHLQAGGGATFADVLSIMPVENTLTSLPISFAGLGLRESIFQTLLSDLAGVPGGVAALIGSAGFCIKLLWSLPGAILFFTYRRAEHRRGV